MGFGAVADLPDLRALFNLPPERASGYLATKALRLTGPYWELDGPQHSRVFTVANLAKLDVLADIKQAVQGAIDSGQTERWFAAQLVDVLRKKGWWGPAVEVDPDTAEARIIQQGSLRRLQTIYRTNLQSAYMAGRHRQAMEQADRAPFAQYLAVRDSRTRPSHAALHGKVFRLDSPEWSVISPPNGYNCRCRARYMSQDELDERGLKLAEDVRILERMPQQPVGDVLTGEAPARVIERGVSVADPQGENGRAILWADRGWDHLPGSDGHERAVVDRLMRRASGFGDGHLELVLDGAERAGVRLVPTQADELPPSGWTRGAVCPDDAAEFAAGGCPGTLPSPRPFEMARLLPAGQEDRWYVERFLDAFGAGIGRPVLFDDVTDEPLLISDRLFLARGKSARTGAPVYKVQKGGREKYLLMLAQTIKQPQEIWERVEHIEALGRTVLRRRYLAWWAIEGEESPGLAVLEWSREWWAGITTFAPSAAGQRDLEQYIAQQRQGILRWRDE